MTHTRTNAPELARGHFGESKRRAHMSTDDSNSVLARHPGVHLAAMRNAWAAFHAGAFWQNTDWTPRHPHGNGGPWSSDCHRGSASGRMSGMVALDEARVRESQLRAEVERLRELVRCAQHHVPRSWPQCGDFLSEAFAVLGEAFAMSGSGTLEVDALTREDGEG